jgi:bla regulator protein blaR1
MIQGGSFAAGGELAMGLVRLLCAGVVVTACAHVIGLALSRQAAETRVTVWRAAVVALLLVPAAAVVLPRWHLPESAAVAGISERLQALWLEAQALSERPDIASVPAAGQAAGIPALDPAAGARVSAPDVLRAFSVLWSAVAFAAFIYLFAGIVMLRASARGAQDVTEPILAELPVQRTGWWLRLRVLRGGPFRVPLCWGVLKPTVLFPSGSEVWTRSRTNAVLLHEATHVERRDGLFLLLARIASAVHWLNPLAWSVQKKLSLDAEVACDAEVVRKGIPAKEYARTLVDVAAEAQQRSRPGLALALVPVGSLSMRVEQILERRAAPPRRALASASAGALVMVALAAASVAYGPGVDEVSRSVSPAADAVRIQAPAPSLVQPARAEAGSPSAPATGTGATNTPPPHAVDPLQLPGAPELPSAVDETMVAKPGNASSDTRDVGVSLAAAIIGAVAPSGVAPISIRTPVPVDRPSQYFASMLPFRRPPTSVAQIRTPIVHAPAAYNPAVMAGVAAVAERFTTPRGQAYKATQLLDAPEANLLAFLMQEQEWTPIPCRTTDRTLGCVSNANGGVVPAKVFVDDKPVTGLELLLARSPREFYQVEITGAATIHAYTHNFVLAMMAKEEAAARAATLRANY